MYLTDGTIDDLLRRVLQKLLKSRSRVKASRGWNAELSGVLLQLENPRARLSRTERKGTIYSCIGELLWYLSKRNDLQFIEYYVPKYRDDAVNGIVRGGYGPRLFSWHGIDQVENVVDLLRRKSSSRRAVIQLFDASDLADTTNIEVPCTCTLQFLIRDQGLDMLASMRSNDAFLGLPHDVFAFTMLQELIASAIGVGLGVYKHFVGSLHLYDDHADKARQYVSEGFQPTVNVEMPAMPSGDQRSFIPTVLECEAKGRQGARFRIKDTGLPDYWADIVRLLQIYHASKRRDTNMIAALRRGMSTTLYNTYIDKRRSASKTAPKGRQWRLPFQNGEEASADGK